MSGLTLVDLQKRLTPNQEGHIAVAEILNKTMPLLKDAPWMPTNKTDSRTTGVRSGLPRSHRRRGNRGTKISKSTVVQNEESTTMREAYAENDTEIIDSFGEGSMEARASESSAFIEGVGQGFCEDLWYGNKTDDPDSIDGLANRYNKLSNMGANNIGQNVINAGGSGGDNSSIYLIKWMPNKVGLIYPKRNKGDAKGAVEHDDLGIQTADLVDAAGDRNLMKVYRDRFAMRGGWCISDWRCVVRICNIDISDLLAAGASRDPMMSSRLRFLLTQALHRLPMGDGMMRIYMNRTVAEYLDIERLKAVGNAGMTYKEVDGMELPTFRNVPIRIDDTLTTGEDAVA